LTETDREFFELSVANDESEDDENFNVSK